jgi:hypothetical protein
VSKNDLDDQNLLLATVHVFGNNTTDELFRNKEVEYVSYKTILFKYVIEDRVPKQRKESPKETKNKKTQSKLMETVEKP